MCGVEGSSSRTSRTSARPNIPQEKIYKLGEQDCNHVYLLHEVVGSLKYRRLGWRADAVSGQQFIGGRARQPLWPALAVILV